MDALTGLAWLLLCQSAGELLSALLMRLVARWFWEVEEFNRERRRANTGKTPWPLCA